MWSSALFAPALPGRQHAGKDFPGAVACAVGTGGDERGEAVAAFVGSGDVYRFFEAMLDGWRAQMLARGLSTSYIKSSCETVQRFQEHANEYPWTWPAHHVDEFLADRRSSEKGLAVVDATRQFGRY